MQVFFQQLCPNIGKNSGKKFEEMFLVKNSKQGNLLKMHKYGASWAVFSVLWNTRFSYLSGMVIAYRIEDMTEDPSPSGGRAIF